MTPQSLQNGCPKKFKLLIYEHIIYSFEARNLDTHSEAKLNRNLQSISFKMMYNDLCYVIGSQMNGGRGGGGGALNHLPLLFCKSMYIVSTGYRFSWCQQKRYSEDADGETYNHNTINEN